MKNWIRVFLTTFGRSKSVKILIAKIANCGMEILKNFPQIRIVLSYENNVNQNQQCLITFYKPVVLSDWTRKAKIIFMTKTKWIKTVSNKFWFWTLDYSEISLFAQRTSLILPWSPDFWWPDPVFLEFVQIIVEIILKKVFDSLFENVR